MTRPGFAKLIGYLEGVFMVQLTGPQRDAWWETLKADQDADLQSAALEYVRSERVRFGFPKPGDLLMHNRTVPTEPENTRPQWTETEREEAKALVASLRAKVLGGRGRVIPIDGMKRGKAEKEPA